MQRRTRDFKIRKIVLKHLIQRELTMTELYAIVQNELHDRRFGLNLGIISSNLVYLRAINIVTSRVTDKNVRLWKAHEE